MFYAALSLAETFVNKSDSNNTIESIPHTIPLDLTVSFPQNTTIFGENLTLTNTKGAKTNQSYYYTVTTLPNLELKDHINNIVEWLSPLNSIWTFLTAIGVVIVPLIIRMYSKQKQTKNNDSSYDNKKKLDSHRFGGAPF